jgi:hypothetical protein
MKDCSGRGAVLSITDVNKIQAKFLDNEKKCLR